MVNSYYLIQGRREKAALVCLPTVFLSPHQQGSSTFLLDSLIRSVCTYNITRVVSCYQVSYKASLLSCYKLSRFWCQQNCQGCYKVNVSCARRLISRYYLCNFNLLSSTCLFDLIFLCFQIECRDLFYIHVYCKDARYFR